jgi:hypothetical protein
MIDTINDCQGVLTELAEQVESGRILAGGVTIRTDNPTPPQAVDMERWLQADGISQRIHDSTHCLLGIRDSHVRRGANLRKRVVPHASFRSGPRILHRTPMA